MWAIVQWLEAELEGVDRCVTPWLLVGMHRPMYVPYPHKSNRVVGRHLQARIASFCHTCLFAIALLTSPLLCCALDSLAERHVLFLRAFSLPPFVYLPMRGAATDSHALAVASKTGLGG